MKFVGPSSEQAINAETDIFGRDEFANGLLNIFKTSDDPLVIALDDEWGTGKTVFARRLADKAAKVGVKAIYYDAFKRDYNPDVFVSLVAEVIALEPKTEKTNELKKKAIGVAKVIGKTLLKGGIRLATAGAVNSSSIDEATKGIANEIGDTIEGEFDKFIDERLSNAAKDEMSFDAFRKSLRDLVQKNDNGKTTPILFIIDELDRCRPDHALELLETIKHLFAVEHVNFLLVINLSQMLASVNKRYGLGVNSNTYLEKFIDVKVAFPKLEYRQLRQALATYLGSFCRDFPDDHQEGKFTEDFVKFCTAIAIKQGYSFRRLERICTSFAVALSLNGQSIVRVGPIIHLLCDMKVSHQALFQKAKAGNLKYEDLDAVYQFSVSNENDRRTFQFYSEIWMYALKPNNQLGEVILNRFSNIENSLHSKEDIVIHIANNIVEPISKT